jgi:hypothetical protein
MLLLADLLLLRLQLREKLPPAAAAAAAAAATADAGSDTLSRPSLVLLPLRAARLSSLLGTNTLLNQAEIRFGVFFGLLGDPACCCCSC